MLHIQAIIVRGVSKIKHAADTYLTLIVIFCAASMRIVIAKAQTNSGFVYACYMNIACHCMVTVS